MMTPQETYLAKLMAFLAPRLENALRGATATMDAWRVTVGTPSGSRRLRSYGACLFGSDGASAEITLSRKLTALTRDECASAVGVGPTLLHELCHAALGPEVNDRSLGFKRLTRAVGLISGEFADEGLERDLWAFEREHGPYPVSPVDESLTPSKPQTTRLLKASCTGCGYVIRLTAKWVATGLPTCHCGTVFNVEK
jgi:hypothetical protein